MAKKLLLVVTLFIGIHVTYSQKPESRYGFRVGLNYSDIDFEDDSFGIIGGNDSGERYGFAAGFFATYFLSANVSLQPELQYAALGETSKVVFDNNSGDPESFSTDKLKINTIQLPILLNYHFGKGNKFSISAGPQVGISIWEWEREADYETIQFSAIGGIGYDIIDNLGLNLRASYGFTDVIDTNTEDFKATGTNNYIQLSIFYRL